LVLCNGKAVRTVTRDLSRSGCAVEASLGRAGDAAVVILQLGELKRGASLALSARCVHKSAQMAGLEFSSIADIDRLTLAEALDERRCDR
jgi:hypothetical protein